MCHLLTSDLSFIMKCIIILLSFNLFDVVSNEHFQGVSELDRFLCDITFQGLKGKGTLLFISD